MRHRDGDMKAYPEKVGSKANNGINRNHEKDSDDVCHAS